MVSEENKVALLMYYAVEAITMYLGNFQKLVESMDGD